MSGTDEQNELNKLFFQAVENRNYKKAGSLLAQGADVNAADKNGMTALQFAAQKRNTEIVEFLLTHGANASAKGSRSKAPLSFAVEEECTEIVKLLL